MPIIRIDGAALIDWPSFHRVFAEAFGFPSFYGHNMDAWIDCMSSLDADDGMTTIRGSATDPVVLRIDHARAMPKELLDALTESAAFVNWRRLEANEPAILLLAFDR